MVGDDGSDSSFASHRKKLSAFTIESILSGMADIKDEDSLSETNMNTSFEEGMERDFARSPSPTTSTASSPPTSPHMSAVMAHHIRQYQVTRKENISMGRIFLSLTSSSGISAAAAAVESASGKLPKGGGCFQCFQCQPIGEHHKARTS